MRCLLDTHAILWYVDASTELPAAVRGVMDSSECFFSVASLWEIAIKQSLGRLNRHTTLGDYTRVCEAAGFVLLPIGIPHLERLKHLPDIHRDPFDRLLVAQALEEDLAIVTRDRMIPQYPVRTVW